MFALLLFGVNKQWARGSFFRVYSEREHPHFLVINTWIPCPFPATPPALLQAILRAEAAEKAQHEAAKQGRRIRETNVGMAAELQVSHTRSVYVAGGGKLFSRSTEEASTNLASPKLLSSRQVVPCRRGVGVIILLWLS